MKYSKYINYSISLEMMTNIRSRKEYFSIVFFFFYNTTGIMLSPILINVQVNIPNHAPAGSHKT